MDKLIYRLFQVCIAFMVLWGAHAWFTWQMDFFNPIQQVTVLLFFNVISFLYKKRERIIIDCDHKIIIACVCFVIARCFPSYTLNALFVEAFKLFPLIVLLNDRKNSEKHLEFISWTLALIMIPGFIVFLIVNNGYPLSGIPMQYYAEDDWTYIFINRIFLITDYNSSGFDRFNSVFLEPGYLGTLISFLLYANRFDFKKKVNIILLVGLIASFSLAGYIVALLGYIIIKYNNKKNITVIVSIFFMVAIVWLCASLYNDGDNYFYRKIFGRLAFDSETGIAGNNRFEGNTNSVFSYFWSNGRLLFGNENILKDLDVHGAGYKIFFITNGIVAAILYFLFYFFISKYSNDRLFRKGFVLIIVITFLQAAYPTSYSWQIPFILGISASYNSNSLVEKKLDYSKSIKY